MEIVYVYQKKRRNFGKQLNLQDKPAELTVNILPDPSYISNYTIKNPSFTEVQAVPEMSEHDVYI
jgi:dynein intermediate chain 2